MFLTTQDTTYISQTVIDGNPWGGRVVEIINGENATAVLCGFTITNGEGGILIHNNSNPQLENLIITGNHCNDQFDRGGGIWIHGTSSPIIKNVNITGNSVNGNGAGIGGGGIYCEFSSYPSLINVTITDNFSIGGGGGIKIINSTSCGIRSKTDFTINVVTKSRFSLLILRSYISLCSF